MKIEGKKILEIHHKIQKRLKSKKEVKNAAQK